MPGADGGAAASPPVVIAVVVTYNRRELLLEALAAVYTQSRPPDAVIVVDNASTDGTAAAVRELYPAAELAGLTHNAGGAGGFAGGMALALARTADLVWLMDDDTVPEPGALEALLAARDRHPVPPPALVASRVIWTDGRAHPMNTPRTKPFASKAERLSAEAADAERSQAPVVGGERYGAHRLDPLGEQRVPDLGAERFEVRPQEPPRLSGRERHARG